MKRFFRISILFTVAILCVFSFASRLLSQECSHDHGDSAIASDSHAGHDHEKPAIADADPHAGHDHEKPAIAAADPHAGHDHSAHQNVGSQPIEKLSSLKCEHDILTIDCDECRYELGAVKITPQLEKMVKLQTLSAVSRKHEVNFRGELEYDNQMFRTVTSLVPGIISSMPVRKGDIVAAGQVIAVIESRELSHLALELQKQIAELALAEKKLAREEMLNEKKVGALQSVQEARAARDLIALEIRCSKEQLALFGLSAKQVAAIASGRGESVQKGALQIIAPIQGRVVAIHSNIGSAVGEQQALVDIVDIRQLRAVGQIKEADIPAIIRELGRGQLRGFITTQAFPGNLFPAVAVSADAGLKPTTRMLEIQLSVRNPDELLRPGMFIEGNLEVADGGEKSGLPSSALLEDEGVDFVFVRKGAMFFRRDVSVESKQGDVVYIASGLENGDEIVIEGSFLLKSDILRGKMGAGCAH